MTAPATGIVMLHSVGAPDPAWTWSHLTVPWRLFDRQLAVLRRFGYRSVFLDEYLDMARAGLIERERVVALTFDDGYLDNWVYAAPLLERHGFVGTVFMTTDFIDPSPNPRPRLNPDRPEETALSRPGFLSWPEMRALEHSGVMRVESHARTHTWYPADPEIVDFRHPGDDYHWMDWNDAPDRKWAYLRAEERPEVWGEPVYRHVKALEGPRYLPDPGLAMVLRAAVGRAGPEFFSRPGWRDDLFAQVRAHGELLRGRHETRLEFLARAWAELDDSRRILSEGLAGRCAFCAGPAAAMTTNFLRRPPNCMPAPALPRATGAPGPDSTPRGAFAFGASLRLASRPASATAIWNRRCCSWPWRKRAAAANWPDWCGARALFWPGGWHGDA
jgi:hypothetical protein